MALTMKDIQDILENEDADFIRACGKDAMQVITSRPELQLMRARNILLGQIAMALLEVADAVREGRQIS